MDERSKCMNTFQKLNVTQKILGEYLTALQEQKSIELNAQEKISLTANGRSRITVVMAGGSFDIIHPGHIQTLKQAKNLGDILIVSVARNLTYEKSKHKKPVNDEKLRLELVSSIRYVDAAVLGSETNMFETVEFLRPDIIALGYDQFHTESAIQRGVVNRGSK